MNIEPGRHPPGTARHGRAGRRPPPGAAAGGRPAPRQPAGRAGTPSRPATAARPKLALLPFKGCASERPTEQLFAFLKTIFLPFRRGRGRAGRTAPRSPFREETAPPRPWPTCAAPAGAVAVAGRGSGGVSAWRQRRGSAGRDGSGPRLPLAARSATDLPLSQAAKLRQLLRKVGIIVKKKRGGTGRTDGHQNYLESPAPFPQGKAKSELGKCM